MSWNYRVVKYRDPDAGYGLHEVYYNQAGEATRMTAEPCRFACDSEEGPEGIKQSLLMARVDATQRPVFDEPEVWAKP